ncbi:MAG TPA: hypothetical protein DCQ92_16830 [Verrucomicrobia subdivision 3 bacterium]|nr:hypothetical protein [Limisphaerales bacterium]
MILQADSFGTEKPGPTPAVGWRNDSFSRQFAQFAEKQVFQLSIFRFLLGLWTLGTVRAAVLERVQRNDF